jgi:hypothetical protein
MRFACWITRATDTHSQYVILIAFPRQQWLHERASILRLYATLPVLSNIQVLLEAARDLVTWLSIRKRKCFCCQ